MECIGRASVDMPALSGTVCPASRHNRFQSGCDLSAMIVRLRAEIPRLLPTSQKWIESSMNEHEKWLSRRVYHETFSTPGEAFPGWRGAPNRCNCGCDKVWYDRLSPINWWATFNPGRYMSIMRHLVRVFFALHGVLWHLSPLIWLWLQTTRARYKREVMNRAQPGSSASIAIIIARLLLYGIVVPLTVVVWAAVWVLSRPGVILLIALYLLSLVLVAAVLLIPLVLSVVAISTSGLVLILGGVGSIIYLDNPAVGITAIAIGVGVQYELHRRESKRREEQLGYLIRMLRPQTRIDPSH